MNRIEEVQKVVRPSKEHHLFPGGRVRIVETRKGNEIHTYGRFISFLQVGTEDQPRIDSKRVVIKCIGHLSSHRIFERKNIEVMS